MWLRVEEEKEEEKKEEKEDEEEEKFNGNMNDNRSKLSSIQFAYYIVIAFELVSFLIVNNKKRR